MITNPSKWSMKDLDVLIIGGSISGLTTAIALARHGANVRIRERSAVDRSARGGGMMVRREAQPIYTDFGVEFEPGVMISSRRQKQFFDEREIKAPDAQSATWAGILRSLQRRLETCEGSVDLRTGYELTHISPSESRPCVQYQNGEIETADLIVVADGAESSAMKLLEPDVRRIYAGYVAWRGQLPMSSLDDAEQAFFDNRLFEQITTSNGYFAGFPILNHVGGRTVKELSWSLCTPEPGDALAGLVGQYAESGIVPPGGYFLRRLNIFASKPLLFVTMSVKS